MQSPRGFRGTRLSSHLSYYIEHYEYKEPREDLIVRDNDHSLARIVTGVHLPQGSGRLLQPVVVMLSGADLPLHNEWDDLIEERRECGGRRTGITNISVDC